VINRRVQHFVVEPPAERENQKTVGGRRVTDVRRGLEWAFTPYYRRAGWGDELHVGLNPAQGRVPAGLRQFAQREQLRGRDGAALLGIGCPREITEGAEITSQRGIRGVMAARFEL